MPDAVGEVISLIAGSFGLGGADPRTLSATQKRQYLLEAARRYGTSSPEYQTFAKKWPKQARKLEQYDLPAGVRVEATAPPPTYDPFAYGRGMPQPLPSSPAQRELEKKILLGVLNYGSFFIGGGGALKLGKGMLTALLRARAKTLIGQDVLKGTGGRILKSKVRVTRMGQPSTYETIIESDIERLARLGKLKPSSAPLKGEKIGPIATKVAKQVSAESKAAAKAATGSYIKGGVVAGVTSAVVSSSINAIFRPKSRTPARVGDLPGAAPGSGERTRYALTPGEAKVQARKIVDAIKTEAATADPEHGTGPGGAAAQKGESATAAAGKRAAQRAIGAASSISTPAWLLKAQQLANDYRPVRSVGRGDQLTFPMPSPQTQTQGLTGFSSGGVGYPGCECAKPKSKKGGKRKRRTVCYTGRFSETATGTRKYSKRKRTTCLPSRKKPASARAR